MTENNIVLDRRLLELKVGIIVCWQGDNYQISDILNFNEIVATHLETFKSKVININELTLSDIKNDATKLTRDDTDISEDDWSVALKRYSIIQPFIEKSSKVEIIKLAEHEDFHYTTIYNWLSAYRKSGSILSLLPNKRGWKESKTRLKESTELIIKQVLKDYHLTEQKPKLSSVAEAVKALCIKNNIDPPHSNTIRYRVRQINEQLTLKSREGKKTAKDKFTPVTGHFPHANHPLAVVQIDHTPLDIIVVDETHRLAIGRPFLTLAIDVLLASTFR